MNQLNPITQGLLCSGSVNSEMGIGVGSLLNLLPGRIPPSHHRSCSVRTENVATLCLEETGLSYTSNSHAAKYGVTLALERTPGVGTICTIYTRAHFALPRAPVLHIRLSCRVHLAGFLRRRASRRRGGAAKFNLCRTRNTFDRRCDAKCSIKI